MEDSGIDSGDAKPSRETTLPLTPSKSCAGVPIPRMMQRKLGPRNRNQEHKKCSGSLLPLQRLTIPGAREQQPLVAWDTTESEEEVVSFFPPHKSASPCGRPVDPSQDLTDAFSVEELSPSDEEEDDRDDLELVVNTSTASPACCPQACCLQ